MKKFVAAACAAFALSLAFAPSTQAGDGLVVNASGVQKLTSATPNFSIKDIIGHTVYTNAGRKLGEVKDFIVTEGGYLYALVKVEDDASKTLLPLKEGERVVVPWNHLRLASDKEISEMKKARK